MSTLLVSNISDGTDTVETGYVVNGSAKAWASVNSSIVVQDSFNLASMTDFATGAYGYNLSSSMSNVFYSATGAKQNSVNNDGMMIFNQAASSASQAAYNYYESGGSTPDPVWAVATVNGDLA